MRRIAALLLVTVICFSLFSCTSSEELYGAWYVDEAGIRNAIQFSENAEGKDAFIWAVYNIEEDSIESNNSGYYKISGDKIIFDFGSDAEPLELSFELEGDTLSIYNESATMTLKKYVLE